MYRELYYCSFRRSLKATTLGKSHYKRLSILLTKCIKALNFRWIFLRVGYVQGALGKELLIASFIERIKTATLGESY